MKQETVIDHRVLERFRRLKELGRMGHAYMFVGPRQTGKTKTAMALAQLVNCEVLQGQPCGQCPSCLKIAHGNHPDVMVIEHDEGSIKIEQIRTLLTSLQLKAFEAKTKVFIIRDVELMTLQAANSLLKTLEEPAANSLMILTTSVPEANLDTIRSRCHVVKFFAASLEQLKDDLQLSRETARFMTVYTDGCVGQAGQLLADDFMAHKNRVLEAILNPSDEEFIKKLSKDKAEAKEALRVVMTLVHDAMLFKSGVAMDELMNVDRVKNIQGLARHSAEELAAIYQQIVSASELLDENLNVKMAFSILRQRLWLN